VYIILAAGAKVLPKSLRFVRYKLWMRIALAIWWLALLLGLTTYARWYVVPQHFSSTGSKAPARTIGSATNPTASGISRLSAMASSLMYTPASLFEPGEAINSKFTFHGFITARVDLTGSSLVSIYESNLDRRREALCAGV
jgi:hypothetical protein